MSSSIRLTFLLLLSVLVNGKLSAQDQPDPRRWSFDPRLTNLSPAAEPAMIPQAILNFENSNKSNRVIYSPQGTYTVAPNFRVHPSTVIWQSEVPITRHPTNPNIMFASSNAVRFSPTTISEGMYLTTDGGVTWFGSDTTAAAPITGHSGDPAPAIGPDGRLYQSYIISGGMGATYSTNMGQTWANTTTLATGSQDKNHTFVDNTPGSPYFGRAYVTWSLFSASPPPAVVSYSTNGGSTWTAPINVLPVASGHYHQGVNGAVGPNGVAYIAWQNPVSGSPFTGDFMGFAKSTDGGATWTGNNNIYDCNGARNASLTPWSIRINDFPSMAIDMTNSARRGWIYIVACELNLAPAGSDHDIVMHRSSDGGTTWSPGIRVNQDVLNNGKKQYMPWMCVDDAGGVNVVYYDNRNSATGDSVEVLVSRSLDGGNTWTDIVVSDHKFRPAPIPGLAGGYQGDYIGITSGNGKLWPYWADNSSGIYQAWTTSITTTENFGWTKGTITRLGTATPVSDATVDFLDPIPQISGNSNASGLFYAGARVDTPATTLNVTMRAKKFGFLDTTLAVTLTRNDTVTRNFQMRPLDLVLTKTSITFPPTPAPGTSRDSLVARNQGTATLNLSSLTSTNPRFIVSPTSANIAGGDSVKIYVTYTPVLGGNDTGRVIVISNSIFTPRADIILNGTAIGVPRFTTNVDSLTRTIEGGVRDSVTFRLRNNGTASGSFSARAVMFPRTAANKPIEMPMTVEMGPASESAVNALVPELLYYKFDETGATATQNFANPGVGTNPAPVIGQTIGSTGQFGSALIGTGAANNYVNTGWNTALGNGSWTISMWLNNLPSNASLFYLFGDNTAGTFRSFLGGAAGAGAITLRATGMANVDVPGVAPGPSVVHFVYDATASNIKAYRNGVLVATVAQGPLNINGTAPLRVGAYSTSAGLPSGGLMDEFRMYNRALTDGEIATTWNTEVGGGNWFSASPTTGTIAINDSVTMKAYFDATDETIYSDPGTYLGRLDVVATNSSLADTLHIPARMFVIPPAGTRISVDHDSLNFGTVQIDSSRTRSLVVRNIGGSTLTVTNITMSNTNFAASPTSFTLASLDTQKVNITFTAPAPGAAHTGSMGFVSNDPASPTVALYATSLGAPAFRVRVDSLKKTLEAWRRDSIQFYMRNAGTSTGEFRALVAMFQNRSAGKQVAVPVTIKPASSSEIHMVGADPVTEGYDPSGTVSMSGGVSTAGGIPQHYNFITGGAANTFPFNVPAGKRIQWIFLPGDFSQPSPAPQGRIATLYFRIATVGSGVFTNVSIQMGQTSLTELPSTDWYAGPMQTVYTRSTDSLSAATIGEWVSIQLDIPFAYDPTQSLVIDITQCARVGTGLSTYHTGATGVRRNASLVGASCPLPFANTSTLMAHCGVDISGGTWLSLEPLQGTIPVADSVLMTAYFDASDTAIANNPGNYFGEISVVATNSQLADTLRVPVRLLVTPSTGIVETGLGIPEEYTLNQNYPNPFNPTTTIKFGLPRESMVKLTIYNILGQEIVTLSDEVRGAGYFVATWDGTNKAGSKVSSGVYFYRMEATSTAGDQTFINLKKMILLK